MINNTFGASLGGTTVGDQYGVGAVISAGYHQKPLDVDITHTQPLMP